LKALVRLETAIFVITLNIFSLAACTNRPDFQEEDARPLADFNGFYLSGAQTADPKSQFEDIDVETLISEGNRMALRQMDPETLEMRDIWFAQLVQSGRNFEFVPNADLAQLSETQPKLRQFNEWFQDKARVRVLLHDNDLKITRIVGNQRTSYIWKKQESERYVQRQGKVQGSAIELRDLRDAFVKRWSEEKLVLFERVSKHRTSAGKEITKVVNGSDLKDEEAVADSSDGQKNKTIINFRRLQMIDAQTAKINDKHPAVIDFRLMKPNQENKRLLYVVIAYNPNEADEKIFRAQPIGGAIEDEGKGIKMSLWNHKLSEFLIRRYQPPGETVPPTIPTPEEPKPEEPKKDSKPTQPKQEEEPIEITPTPTPSQTLSAI
jgi:hypothetical protein